MIDRAPIYLDHHASTPCDPRVVEAMLPVFTEAFGNPSSDQHVVGRAARTLVETARSQVADLLGAEPAEIVFTSGATEANNLALRGLAESRLGGQRRHLVTCVTEHKAVLDVCSRLESAGFEVTYLPVEADGRVSPEAVGAALRPDTLVVSLAVANNEIGTLHPIPEIASRCRERGVLLHCDAAQALAWVDCRIDHLGADLLSLSAHKAYGPKGVGALYVRRRRPRVRLRQQLEGGGHEGGRRSGTLNAPGIVGLGVACALIAAEGAADADRVGALRDRLLDRLREGVPGLRVNGGLEHRLPNNLNVWIPGVAAREVLAALERVAVSAGAACSGAGDGSYVLSALEAAGDEVSSTGDLAEGSLRIGLGRFTTPAEIETAADELTGTIARLARSGPQPTIDPCEVACGV